MSCPKIEVPDSPARSSSGRCRRWIVIFLPLVNSPLWLTLPDLDGGRLGGSAGSTGRVQEAGEVGRQRAGGWEAAQGTTSDAHEVGEPSADTQEVE